MEWLVPAVIATMTGSTILTFCYFYLYLQDKTEYLQWWAISWTIYCFRYIFLLGMLLWKQSPYLLIGNQFATLLSGLLLLYGSCLFIDKKFPKPVWYLFILGTVWIIISVLYPFSFLVMSLPTFIFLAIIYIWTGYVFYSHSKVKHKEASFVGIVFIAWGIHKANYPFLQPVAWFAPWGYLIAAMLEFLTAFGLIIVYFRKTKEESRVAEEKYKGLFDSIRDAIVVADTERSIVECNPAFTELFGYSKNEIMGKKTKYLYENDAQFIEVGEALKKHFGKKIFLKTVNYKKKSGQVFPGETGIYYFKNIESEVVGFIGLIRDISDRKKSEEILKKQNFYLEKAQELGQIGTWELDLMNNRLVWTDENCRIFGVPEGSVVDYETFLSKVHPEDREYVDRAWRAGLEGKPYDIEHRLLLDSEVRWVREKADVRFDDNGKVVSAIGITQNISDRKKTEKSLKENEQRYKSAQRMGKVGNWEYDVVTQKFWGSEQAKQIYGFDVHSEGFTTEEVENCIPERERVHQALIDLIEKDTPYNLEFEIHPITGPKTRTIKSIAEILRDDSGAPLKVIGVIQDITGQKRMERQLIQGQKLEAIGNIAGGIAHDFNNILSSIIGFTELALDETSKGTILEDSLQEVYSAAKRAKDLVKHILAFARQSEEKRKPFQPGMVADEVLKFMRSTIPSSIEIKQNIISDSWIMGNATQMHQVVMNLCTNASHAMEDAGGVLTVSVKDVSIDRTDSLISLRQGEYVELTVSDTGVGISPENMDSIFEPYFTTKGPGEGTGMGLAMVQGVIESYGGEIVVDSVLEKGTIFTIYLPITTQKPTQEAYVPEQLPAGTERVLLIDDEASIAKMGSQILERLGYSVTTRTSSMEGLELFRATPDDFDLVVTDMTMPNLTGDRLAVELMKIRSDIPVILCTGYSKKISNETASEIGIKAFAHKPMVMADLAKTVRKVLDDAKKPTHDS